MATVADVARLKRDCGQAISDINLGDDQVGDIFDEQGGIHVLACSYIFNLAADRASAKGSIAVGRYRESYSEKAQSYRMLANMWRGRYLHKGFAGGLSKADKEARELDTDRIEQPFSIGMHDNPDASNSEGVDSSGS